MPDTHPPVGSGAHPVGRIVIAVMGGLAVIVGVVLLVAGVVLVAGYGTQRDDDGFFTSDEHRLETVGHAIISDEVDLGARTGRDDGLELGDLATVRISAHATGDEPVFVGIGPEDEVARYLDGVDHAEISDLRTDPSASPTATSTAARRPPLPSRRASGSPRLRGPVPRPSSGTSSRVATSPS